MAESDLDIRIRVKNEAEGAVDDLTKGLEKAAEAAEDLAKAGAASSDLASEIEKTAEALKDFTPENITKLGEEIGRLAQEAGVTAETVGKFFTEAVANFEAMSIEAAAAGDTIKSELFDVIAKEIKTFAASPEFAKFVEGLGTVDEGLKETGEAFDKAGVKKDKFRRNMKDARTDADGLGSVFNALQNRILGTAGGFTLATVALRVFDFGMRKLSEAVDKYQEGIREAAQTQQLDTALKALGATSAESSARLDQAVSSLERLGFTGSTARQAAIRMEQAELDLSKSVELGVAARNQAIVTGKSEAEVLNTLITGIANRNARALRSIGLTINQAEAEKKYAATMGRTADELTLTEKQSALTTAALEQMGKASGAAADGATDLNVVLNQVNKESKELSEQVGKNFLPLETAFARLELATIKFLKSFEGSPKIDRFLSHLERMVDGAGLLINDLAEKKFDPLVLVGPVGTVIASIKQIANARGEAANATYLAERKAEDQRWALKEAVATKEKAAADKSIKISKERAEEGLKALIGDQPVEGFTKLSEAGRKAVNSLTAVFDNFSKQTGANIKSTFGQVREAFFSAFAQQKTFSDFENFLSKTQEMALRLGINIKRLQQEGVFRQQKAALEEVNAMMTAFIDASKQTLSIQQSYNNLRQDGVEHEIAMQRITAEVANDQAKLNALSLRSAAIKLETERKNFSEIQQNAIRVRDEQIARINEEYITENEKAKRIAAVRKDFLANDLKANQDYYVRLKQSRDQYVNEVKQAEAELKRVREAGADALRSAAQRVREIERRRQGPEFAAKDVLAERLERQEALKQAISRGDVRRANQEIQALQQIADARESAEGEGDTTARREALRLTMELEEATKQVVAIEEARAVKNLATAKTNLAAMEEQVNAVKATIESLNKQVEVNIKLQLDPGAVVALQKSLDEAKPAELKIMASAASLKDMATQVQSFLDGVSFNITTVAGTQNAPGPRVAKGGQIGGHSSTSTADNILAWLTAGEYVQPVAAVRHYGTAFMESIRKMQFPKFAAGGSVSNTSPSNVAHGDEGGTTLSLNFNGKKLGTLRGSRETVGEVTRALKDLSRGVA